MELTQRKLIEILAEIRIYQTGWQLRSRGNIEKCHFLIMGVIDDTLAAVKKDVLPYLPNNQAK